MGDITQELFSDLTKLLDRTEAKVEFAKLLEVEEAPNISDLITNLQEAKSGQDILEVWHVIAMVLYRTYRVHHGDTSKNSILKDGLLTPLIKVVNACLDDISKIIAAHPELLSQKDSLSKIFELPFMISEFYSVNDQIDHDQFENLLEWVEVTKGFREQAKLSRTIVDAIFLEFLASEISRRFTQKNPHGTLDESVQLFEDSVAIFKENGVTLDGELKFQLQHTMNGLSIARSKQMLALIENSPAIDAATSKHLADMYAKTDAILNEMEPCLLKDGVDRDALHQTKYKDLDVATQVAKPKPMGNLLATKGLILLLSSRWDLLEDVYKASLRCMPVDNTPQYANLENRYANFCVTSAAWIYIAASDNSNANAKLSAIAGHQYVSIARKLFASHPCPVAKEDQARLIAKADSLMATAVQLYANASVRTKVKDEGKSYGVQADKFLLSIHRHPACQANNQAMILVNQMKTWKDYLPTFGYNKGTALTVLAGLSAIAAGVYLSQETDQSSAPKFTLT